MLSILLIILYTSLLTFFLRKLTRRDRNSLSVAQVTTGFVVKILVGMLYGYLFMRFYHGDDTWEYHHESLVEYDKLLHHPLQFISDTFTQTGGNLSLSAAASTDNSFWSNFEEVLFIRMLALFNVLSFGNYYVNVVFFCFIAYLGNLLFYRLLTSYFPRSSFWLYLTIFFYPAVLFWLSGIRKEGLLFLGLAAALYYFDKIVLHHKLTLKNGLLFGAAIVFTALIRNQVVLCLAPVLLAVFLHQRFKISIWTAIAGVYTVSIFLFFKSDLVPHFPNLAQKVTERQHSFLGLEGKTRVALDSLDGSARSFAKVLPQALNHMFLRPYFTQSPSALHLASAVDIYLFFAVVAVVIIFPVPAMGTALRNPVILICLLTALASYVLIGMVVPFPGAFVRYKSIFEILFVSCFAVLCRTPASFTLQKKLY